MEDTSAATNKSMIALPADFVVLDVETTGLDYDENDIIEIAAIRYIDGNRADSFSSLVKPPVKSYYEPDGDLPQTQFVPEFITELTGITNEMLDTAPALNEVLPAALKFIGDGLIVGHNVRFDVQFIGKAAEDQGLKTFCNSYIDTIRIARKVFPGQKHYRLPDVAKMCGVPQVIAHRALSDCEVTAVCFWNMRESILQKMSEESFVALFGKNASSYRSFIKGLDIDSISPDESSPIFGKTVVFTGTLERMVRKDALALVAKLGGIPSDSLTKDTDYLVVGNGDFVKSVKNGKTGKMKKAESFALKGTEIQVVSEDTFFKIIG